MAPQGNTAGGAVARRGASWIGAGRRRAVLALGGAVALVGIVAASAAHAQDNAARSSTTSASPAPAIPSEVPQGREALAALVKSEAERVGLPAGLAETLVALDSDFDPDRVGPAGERGLMQIRLSTAMMLGFRGEAEELDDPRVNVRYGVAHLHQAWRIADGDLCRALLKYRTHYGAERANARSNTYCEQARTALAARGVTFGTAVAGSGGGELPAGVTAFAPAPSAVTIIPPGSATGTAPAATTGPTVAPSTTPAASGDGATQPTDATRRPATASLDPAAAVAPLPPDRPSATAAPEKTNERSAARATTRGSKARTGGGRRARAVLCSGAKCGAATRPGRR